MNGSSRRFTYGPLLVALICAALLAACGGPAITAVPTAQPTMLVASSAPAATNVPQPNAALAATSAPVPTVVPTSERL